MSKHAIILIEGEYADAYATLTIVDDTLWAWLNEEPDFGDQTSITVSPPGYPNQESVTIGSWQNDKAIALAALLSEDLDGENFTAVVETSGFDELEEDEFDDEWRKAVAEICTMNSVVDTYEGLYY